MRDSYKAVIVEDEAPARRLLNELLAAHRQLIELSGEAGNGREAIAMINQIKPDVIFLDIQLPDMLGLDVLKGLDYHPYVIFTTAYDEYAIRAFDALSIDYVLKPLKEDRVARALTKLRQFAANAADAAAAPNPPSPSAPFNALAAPAIPAIPAARSNWNDLESLFSDAPAWKEMKTLSVKKGNKFTLVQLADIAYFEAADKYTFVHLTNGQKLFCDHMLAVLEEKLPAGFVRVQKSYIVNRQKIVEVHKYSNKRFTLVINNRDFSRIITGPSYLTVVKGAFQL